MNTYELTLVLKGSQDETKRKAIVDRVTKLITNSGGKVNDDDKGAKKTLAYPINHEKEGVYYFWTVALDPDKTNPLVRLLENDDDILRQLMVRVEDSAEVQKEAKKEEKVEVKEAKTVKKKETKAKGKKVKK